MDGYCATLLKDEAPVHTTDAPQPSAAPGHSGDEHGAGDHPTGTHPSGPPTTHPTH